VRDASLRPLYIAVGSLGLAAFGISPVHARRWATSGPPCDRSFL